jgi:hypothetical protein
MHADAPPTADRRLRHRTTRGWNAAVAADLMNIPRRRPTSVDPVDSTRASPVSGAGYLRGTAARISAGACHVPQIALFPLRRRIVPLRPRT